MNNSFAYILSENKVVLVIALVIAICLFILCLVKKLRTLTTFVFVVVVVLTVLIPFAITAYNDYNFRYNDGIISIVADGNDYSFTMDDISNIAVSKSNNKDGYIDLKIDIKDGQHTTIEFPEYMSGIIEKVLVDNKLR